MECCIAGSPVPGGIARHSARNIKSPQDAFYGDYAA
jgi:hypothetical protein